MNSPFEENTLKDLAARFSANNNIGNLSTVIPLIKTIKTSVLSDNAIETQNRIEENTSSLNVDEMLATAADDNDITPEMAVELKKTYEGRPQRLKPVLEELSILRVKHLMSLSWEQLDKSNMGEELNRKFFLGYQFKWYVEFGNTGMLKTNPKYIDMKRLIEWAVKEGIMSEGRAEWLKQFPQNFDFEKIKQEVIGWLDAIITEYNNSSWDELERNGKLEWLKENYFEMYKKKYQEEFGIPYTGSTKK